MKVPFLDLKAQYETIKYEMNDAIQKVIDLCAFAGGPFVEKFEQAYAKFCECRYCIGVGSGTEALWLALLSLGIGVGDEVITVPNTFIATCEAVSMCGAKPVFVDIDEKYYTIDPSLIEAEITKKTKAIIPVHLFGQMADMDTIMEIAKKYGLFVIEDACQAHGAEYKGKHAGTIGDVGCFSFYPGKNLGAYGEAGAVVTNDKQLNNKIRMLRDHGQTEKYHHSVVGWNSRMDGIQGAILNVKIKYLKKWNKARRDNANFYTNAFIDIKDVIVPVEAKTNEHVYHVYALQVRKRDQLINTLKEKNIFCGIHYPTPLHLQKAYSLLHLAKGRYPIAERCSERFISLPMYAELTLDHLNYVVYAIDQFYKRI